MREFRFKALYNDVYMAITKVHSIQFDDTSDALGDVNVPQTSPVQRNKYAPERGIVTFWLSTVQLQASVQ
jgi:hypothetical protein